MDKEDIFILCVNAAGDNPIKPIQMRHALYLVGQSGIPEISPDYWTFTPGAHGPQNLDIQTDMQPLVDQGFLWHFPSTDGLWKEYAITPSGARRAGELNQQANPTSVKHIIDLVGWVQANTIRGLMDSIRQHHPDQAENLLFQPVS